MENLKKQYEIKIKMLSEELDMLDEYINFNKKTAKFIWITSGLFLVLITVFNIITNKQLNSLDVISISLMVCTLHRSVFDYISQKNDSQHKVTLVKLELNNLKRLVNELDKYKGPQEL